jgi:hypothetical protein
MNARQDWADTAERPFLRKQDAEDRERDEFDAEVERATKTIRSTFERAWKDEAVMLPYVSTTGLKYSTPLALAIADAVNVADEDNPPALRALRAAVLPGADVVLCIGTFRAAVEDAYIEQQADLMAQHALGLLQ